MFRWPLFQRGTSLGGGSSSSHNDVEYLPEHQPDIETPEASGNSRPFMSRLFDSRPITALIMPGCRRQHRTISDNGHPFHPADVNEMERGGARKSDSSTKGSHARGITAWDPSTKPAASVTIHEEATAAVYQVKLHKAHAVAAVSPLPPPPPRHQPAPPAYPRPPRPAAPCTTTTAGTATAAGLWIPRRRRTTCEAAPLGGAASDPVAAHQLPHCVPAVEEEEPPAPPPCPLRPCPPSSSGLRVESFTSGTNGRLLRPGVGIGEGTMREARYRDLRFIHQIGEGGFGKVYYGHWCGAPVAIKVASVRSSDSGGGGGSDHGARLLEFQREVTNMSTIPQHANVLKLLAACMEEPHMALVTEFCSRGSLYGMLHTTPEGPSHGLQPHQLLGIWLGVARGMQHLHACRVVHRDLKSANLLLDDVGSVKIADFGLSRLYHSDTVQYAMTGALGTFQWMAPEVLTSQRYTEKADVYSFGMVMWECLTRRLPYEGMTAMQAGLGVATFGLRPELPADVDPRHACLIRECWAPVADQRPSFPQIVERLEAMLEAPAPVSSGISEGLCATTTPVVGATTAAAAPGGAKSAERAAASPVMGLSPEAIRERPLTARQSMWGGGGQGMHHEGILPLVGPPPRPSPVAAGKGMGWS